MAEIKIVLVDENPMLSKSLNDALVREGFDVINCFGGFDALDELGSNGADLVIASTSLPDLSGYQLSCLIKSNDRTSKLPVILIKASTTDQDQFWETAALPDEIMDGSALKESEKILDKVKELTKNARESGWRSSMVKNLLVPSRAFNSSNVINSYAGLLDDLLIERLVTRLTRNMSALAEPRKRFVDGYFSLINSLFSAEVIGLVVASLQNPWAAFKIEGGLSESSFQQMLNKVKQQLNISGEVSVDLRGELVKDEEKYLGDFELLPITGEKLGSAALIFAPSQKASFNAQSKAFMSQLQMQMQPVVQLLLAKQEIEVLHSREAYNSSIDALTGLYNLEFLIGFLQQQLLFSYRQKLEVGLAIIDIDNFSALNESFGYEIGDYVISTIGSRLLTITRSSDLVARYSGDEFAIVLPNTDQAGTKVLAEKVRAEIESLDLVHSPGDNAPKVTVSVGCAQFDLTDLNPETMLRDAKFAMQKAKEAGKNQSFHAPSNGKVAEQTESGHEQVDSSTNDDTDASNGEAGDIGAEHERSEDDTEVEVSASDAEESAESSQESEEKGRQPASRRKEDQRLKAAEQEKQKAAVKIPESKISDELEDSEFEISEPEETDEDSAH